MFYASEGGKPIKVKGSLVVYAFDDSERDPTKVKPDRKFVFTTEQFEKHYSKSALGHSYSVWLPWDEAGGPRREISLLVRFTPDNGPAVVGDESKQNLPGPAEGDPAQFPEPEAIAAPAGANSANAQSAGAVQTVAYEQPIAGHDVPGAGPTAANSPKRMTTTTISIPGTNGLRPSTNSAAPRANDGAGISPSSWQALEPRTIQYAESPPAHSSASVPWANSAASLAANSSAMSPSPAEADPALTHYGPSRRRPLGAPLERLDRDRAPWQPTR
jgi:hypothetical protein